MARNAALHRRTKIPIELVKPDKATRTGEMVVWGKRDYPVYREPKPYAMRSRQVHRLKPDGSPVSELQSNGTHRVLRHRVTHTPMLFYANGKPVPEDDFGIPLVEDGRETQENPAAFREYILIDCGTGKDEKLFNFREDPEKLAERQRERDKRERTERMMEALADLDIEPEEIAARLAGVKK